MTHSTFFDSHTIPLMSHTIRMMTDIAAVMWNEGAMRNRDDSPDAPTDPTR